MDVFETKYWERIEEEIPAKAFPDITIRTETLDHHCLLLLIGTYAVWVRQAGTQTIEIDDEEREVFYEGLLHELLREYAEEMRKYVTLIRQHAPGFYNSLPRGPPNGSEDEDEETESNNIINWEEEFRQMFTLRPADESSGASFTTAATRCNSETSSNISDWIDDLPDSVSCSPTGLTLSLISTFYSTKLKFHRPLSKNHYSCQHGSNYSLPLRQPCASGQDSQGQETQSASLPSLFGTSLRLPSARNPVHFPRP